MRGRIGSAAVISVVVPVHEEERTVALLFDELQAALDPLGQPWEAVFVDDGSTDGSFAALTRLHNLHDNVRVVRLRRNFGKAAALAAGFANAQGDVVVTIDADLQDDPAEIPRLLAKLDEGFDLVSGWKAHRRDPITRRIPSRIFNWVTGRVSGLRPLLILGVLLVVVGLQFFSLGLISELITSQHEERAGPRERTELHVDEILS